MSDRSRFPHRPAGLTARSALVSLAVALLVIGAMALTLWALTRQSQALAQLREVQVEHLMASTRLMQQADLLDNEAARLAVARTHAERRAAWVELTDRITWVGKLIDALHLPPGDAPQAGELAHRVSQIGEHSRALHTAVTQRIDEPGNAAHEQAVARWMEGIEIMTGALSTQLGLVAANSRRLLAEQSRQLAQDVAAHRNTTIVLGLGLLLAVVAAALWFDRKVVRRVLALKRIVDEGVGTPPEGAGPHDEIGSLAETVRSYIRRIQAHEQELSRANKELAFQADHDALTQMPNRRFFERRAMHRVAQPGGPLWVLIGDVDRFKQVNDQHGHVIGDRALVHVASLLRANLRDGEALARFGGEEFVAVVPAPTADAVYRIVDRVRAAVAATPMPLPGGGGLAMSISFGLARITPVPADAAEGDESAARRALDAALRAADDALYLAKRSGRNRVEIARAGAPQPVAQGEVLEV